MSRSISLDSAMEELTASGPRLVTRSILDRAFPGYISLDLNADYTLLLPQEQNVDTELFDWVPVRGSAPAPSSASDQRRVSMSDITARSQAAADSMASDTTGIPQVKFPAGQSPFEKMPLEILEKIARIRIPDDWDMCQTPWLTHKNDISKLFTLCLVSKTLESVVRPAIFRNVTIRRSADLIRLLRALLENRTLGGHIRRLTLSTTFLRQDKGYEELDLQLLKGLDPDFDSAQPRGSAVLPSREENQVRINIYLKVLNKAPNVVEVTMNTPSWVVRSWDAERISPYGIASVMANNHITLPQTSLARIPETLKVLTIEGQHEGLMEGVPRHFSKLWIHETTQASKLEKMVWLKANTTWFYSLPSRQWGPDGRRGVFTSLTTLHLVDSACRFSDIDTVCESFPSLKSLKIQLNFLQDNSEDSLSQVTPPVSLTHSITKLRHLKQLGLDLLSLPDNPDLLGPNGVLELSSLPALLDAAVSFRLLVSNKKIPGTDGKFRPPLVLPRLLTTLSIIVRGFEGDAVSAFMDLLEELHASCSNDLPHLKSITYEYAAGDPPFGRERTCTCACVPHEDYCSYNRSSGLSYIFMPIFHTKFQDLAEEFYQLGVNLKHVEIGGSVLAG